MTEDIIKERLTFLKPTQFNLENESELHRGHKGNTGGEHFNLYIVSELFEGKNTMERHRIIYKALDSGKYKIIGKKRKNGDIYVLEDSDNLDYTHENIPDSL